MNVRNKIATIVPMAHFVEIKADHYFMGLVHAAAANSVYFDFYKSRAEAGGYVILDNSTVELGHPFDAKEYIRVANEMGSSEICLPDLFKDMEGTLKAGQEFLSLMAELYDEIPCNLMAIPQGKSPDEWLQCAKVMLRDWPIDTIGISCRYTEMFGNRSRAVNLIEGLIGGGRKIHLLGNYLPPEEEVALLLRKRVVRGVDSSTPCVFTQAKLYMGNEHKSPQHHHINFLEDKYDPTLLHYNMEAWRKGCEIFQR